MKSIACQGRARRGGSPRHQRSRDLRAQSAARSGLRASVAVTSAGRVAQARRCRDHPGRLGPRRVGSHRCCASARTTRSSRARRCAKSSSSSARRSSRATCARDVIVVLGTVQIANTAVIGGSLVVIGGNVTVQPGASVRQDLVVVGGGLDAPADFAARRTAHRHRRDRARRPHAERRAVDHRGAPARTPDRPAALLGLGDRLLRVPGVAGAQPALHRYRAHVRGRHRGQAVHDVPDGPARPASHRPGVGHPRGVGDRHPRRAVRALRRRHRVDHREGGRVGAPRRQHDRPDGSGEPASIGPVVCHRVRGHLP